MFVAVFEALFRTRVEGVVRRPKVRAFPHVESLCMVRRM
jgi:hypothetical protein